MKGFGEPQGLSHRRTGILLTKTLAFPARCRILSVGTLAAIGFWEFFFRGGGGRIPCFVRLNRGIKGGNEEVYRLTKSEKLKKYQRHVHKQEPCRRFEVRF